MSNLSLSLEAGYSVDSPALSKPVALPPLGLKALFRKLSAAVYEAQRRRAEAEIARFIAANGGIITDDLERQISRRFGV